MNTGVPFDTAAAASRVLGIQSKLHDRAMVDPGRRFDDLFNLVADPAFLLQAWRRVRANTGARTAGIDEWTAHEIENTGESLAGFLARTRADVKARVFAPLPVAERTIQRAGGKVCPWVSDNPGPCGPGLPRTRTCVLHPRRTTLHRVCFGRSYSLG